MMPHSEIIGWLRETDPARIESLRSEADEVRRAFVGEAIHLRGIIDFSNHCTRRCTYCGINADNRELRRYLMSVDEIMACVRPFESQGLMTIVLQSGDDSRLITTAWITDLIRRIRDETELAITLSLGERRPEELEEWRAVGAGRYLLKIETSDRVLYESTQPGRRDAWQRRMDTLQTLRDLDYEVGSGIMVGLPGQTFEMLADDLVHLGDFEPDMIGIGPWLPHPATALAEASRAGTDQVPDDTAVTLKVLALARLICPDTNLPATTALFTAGGQQARVSGLSGGANVIMPDLTPARFGEMYTIYPSRPASSPADLRALMEALREMGRPVSTDSGVSVAWLKRSRIGATAPADRGAVG